MPKESLSSETYPWEEEHALPDEVAVLTFLVKSVSEKEHEECI